MPLPPLRTAARAELDGRGLLLDIVGRGGGAVAAGEKAGENGVDPGVGAVVWVEGVERRGWHRKGVEYRVGEEMCVGVGEDQDVRCTSFVPHLW